MFKRIRTNPDRDASWNAVFAHYYEIQNHEPGAVEVYSYSDRLSYSHGDILNLHVSTVCNTYDVRITRDGLLPTLVYQKKGLQGEFHPTPVNCSATGCDWPVSLSIEIENDWTPGVYVVEVIVFNEISNFSRHHLFVLLPRKSAPRKKILLIMATCTWTAYNDWGGSNHYEGISGDDGSQYSPILSLQRPFSRGLIQLPDNAPRIPLNDPPGMLDPPRYPHMEWAYKNEYSKKYASAGWASYERWFVLWAELNDYDVDIITQHDLHYRPYILSGYPCVCMVGHDEYWTWQMRDVIDEYVGRGGNVARFAGNFLWQIRFEDQGNTQVCYKYRAFAEDPVYATNDSRLTTTFWEAKVVDRPGAQTFGLNASRGLYAGWGGCCPRNPGGFTVYRPEHWAFANTGLSYADMVGAGSRIFGYEVDGLDYTFKGGLPVATGTDGAPSDITILAMSPATLEEYRPAGYEGDLFIGQDDVRAAAIALYGDTEPETIEALKRGAGMIVTFTKGKGQLFHAGTCEWVTGLKDKDPYVEQITRNVLNRFLQ